MSNRNKRTLNELTNDKKRLTNDSAIDLNYDIEQLKSKQSQSFSSISISSESFIEDDSMFDDDDDVFEDQRSITGSLSKSTSQNQGRKRLNGTSTYRTKENKNKRSSKKPKKENILIIDQTLNQLREEQARIDAHSLSVNGK